MSIRYICDECDREIDGKPWGSRRPQTNWGGLGATNSRISLYVTLSNQGVWNNGHYCGHCVSRRLRDLAQDLESGKAREAS